jgi:tRNA1(Val) A37 N6-methylase TrmN6
MMEGALIKRGLNGIFDINRVERLNFNVIKTDKDLMSSVFEKLAKKEDREKYGQFFTHKEIIDFILDNIPLKKDSLILDPTCGAGAFLIEAFKRGCNIDRIYGVDIDAKAIEMCKFNLSSETNKNSFNLLTNNFIGNPNIKERLSEVMTLGGFDLIIGNPPFINLTKEGSDYSSDYPFFNEVSSGVINALSLVIARSYELLKEGGYLGFVLPKNILRVDSFRGLREFILKKTRIHLVLDLDHHFKDVRGDQIILIFQKKSLNKEELEKNKIKIIPYKDKEKFSDRFSYYLSQEEFKKYDFFPLFYDIEVKKLADKLMNIPKKLEEVTDIFRGISVGASSELISKKPSNELTKCFRGDSISRFGIKYPLYIDLKLLGKKDANKIKRLQNEKVVAQNICSKEGGIFATLSSDNELSLDTVTNIVTKDISLDTRFILGLVGSRLSNFFMTFVVYLNSNFTMHTDKMYLGRFPIITPSKSKKELIISLVDILLNIQDKYSDQFSNVYSRLNKEVYEIYGLTNSEILLIESLLNKVMSKKHHG